ncbi:hypothetical protein TNCV_4155661 [Trichonephila clavipes]|nr:hypothetical protein TNCV_4155661 [Trichonephila clavipes]
MSSFLALLQLQEFFPPTSDASEADTLTTPPCHIFSTNQQSPSHKGLTTSGFPSGMGWRNASRSISQRRRHVKSVENSKILRSV